MSRWTFLFSLLFPFQAVAADYHPAMQVSTAGALAPVAGVALVGVAYAASRNMTEDQQSAMGTGSALLALPLVVIGPPVMTGGAMRARKALSEQGIVVSNIPGWISWGCFAGTLLTGWSYPVTSEKDIDPLPYEIAQGSLFVAGYAAGIVQHVMVRHAHATTPVPTPAVSLAPLVDDEARGLALVGTF